MSLQKKDNKLVSTDWVYTDHSDDGSDPEAQQPHALRRSGNVNLRSKNKFHNEILYETDNEVDERQPPDGENSSYDDTTLPISEAKKNKGIERMNSNVSHNSQISITRSKSNSDLDIDIQIDIALEELGTDIKKIIQSMEDLEFDMSDLSSDLRSDNGSRIVKRNSTIRSGNFERKKSMEAEDINRWSDPARPVAKSSSRLSRKSKNSINAFSFLRKSTLKDKRAYSSENDILKCKDIQNITSFVNENFDESKAFKSSVNGIDLGTVRPPSVNANSEKGMSTLQRRMLTTPRVGELNRYYPPGEKWRIIRNVVVISFAYMILFTAFYATAYLQSSINMKNGLGTWSLVAEYLCRMASTVFLPLLVIKWLGCKWSMVVGCLLYAPYMLVQFCPMFETLIPTAAIMGLAFGILWCAKATYLCVMAETYMAVTNADKESTMVLFFGIFFFFFFMAIIWGNFISSEILLSGKEESKWIEQPFDTGDCGSKFVPMSHWDSNNPNLTRPPDDKLFIIWGIFVGLVVLAAALLAIGVDSLSRYNEATRLKKNKKLSKCQLVVSSLKHLTNRYQLMLIPLFVLGGVSEGMLSANFTVAYISCSWGIAHIGHVMTCFGAVLLCASLFTGCFAVRILGRLPVLVYALSALLAVLVTLKFWEPNGGQTTVFYIVAVVWGVAETTEVVTTAMQGVIFMGLEEEAYSNLVFWRSSGFLLIYAIHPYVSMDVNLLVSVVVLGVAVIGYITFEFTWKDTPVIKGERSVTLPSHDGMVDIPLPNNTVIK